MTQSFIHSFLIKSRKKERKIKRFFTLLLDFTIIMNYYLPTWLFIASNLSISLLDVLYSLLLKIIIVYGFCIHIKKIIKTYSLFTKKLNYPLFFLINFLSFSKNYLFFYHLLFIFSQILSFMLIMKTKA